MADRMSLTAADTKEILLDVDGYTATKEMAGECEYFESEEFSVGGYDWAVRYYPSSEDPFISVVLVLQSKPTDEDKGRVGVRFECAMVDRYGETSTGVWKSSSYMFSDCGVEKGFWEFATYNELEDPDFLVGDSFRLSCTVTVLKKPLAIL